MTLAAWSRDRRYPQGRRLVLRETGQMGAGRRRSPRAGQQTQREDDRRLQAPAPPVVAGLTEAVDRKQCLWPLVEGKALTSSTLISAGGVEGQLVEPERSPLGLQRPGRGGLSRQPRPEPGREASPFASRAVRTPPALRKRILWSQVSLESSGVPAKVATTTLSSASVVRSPAVSDGGQPLSGKGTRSRPRPP